MKHRQERLASLIQEELNKLISKNIEFSDCLVTITNVEIDNKLSRAVVGFSVFSPCEGCPMKCLTGEASQKNNFERTLKILDKNRSHLQYLLMKKINIKPMPQITFRADYGPEKAAEIEKLLLEDKIKE